MPLDGALSLAALVPLLAGAASLAEMLERTQCPCYGLGLHFLQTPFGPGIGHGGGDLGTLREVRYFPDVDATLVLLANGGNSGVPERPIERLWDETMQAALGTL